MDVPERQARSAHAEQLLPSLAEQGVSMVATTFVDNAGLTRVKSVPLYRLPQLAAWGWVPQPASTTSDLMTGSPRRRAGRHRWVIFALSRTCGGSLRLAAQPGWAWAPGDRYRQDGEPHERCSRLLLQRLVDHAVGDGLEIKAAHRNRMGSFGW